MYIYIYILYIIYIYIYIYIYICIYILYIYILYNIITIKNRTMSAMSVLLLYMIWQRRFCNTGAGGLNIVGNVRINLLATSKSVKRRL